MEFEEFLEKYDKLTEQEKRDYVCFLYGALTEAKREDVILKAFKHIEKRADS